jgi:cytochrome c peroxidase
MSGCPRSCQRAVETAPEERSESCKPYEEKPDDLQHIERAGQSLERLFHDATIGHQSWQSCASCHPDGRAGGLNWDLLNDGIGNPKNTKSVFEKSC